ncbi:MAG: hypothetical protein J7L38_06265 [Thermoproteales archaeon]|nr:hypothetical protein [Thermoproteales archaeon]
MPVKLKGILEKAIRIMARRWIKYNGSVSFIIELMKMQKIGRDLFK